MRAYPEPSAVNCAADGSSHHTRSHRSLEADSGVAWMDGANEGPRRLASDASNSLVGQQMRHNLARSYTGCRCSARIEDYGAACRDSVTYASRSRAGAFILGASSR